MIQWLNLVWFSHVPSSSLLLADSFHSHTNSLTQKFMVTIYDFLLVNTCFWLNEFVYIQGVNCLFTFSGKSRSLSCYYSVCLFAQITASTSWYYTQIQSQYSFIQIVPMFREKICFCKKFVKTRKINCLLFYRNLWNVCT